MILRRASLKYTNRGCFKALLYILHVLRTVSWTIKIFLNHPPTETAVDKRRCVSKKSDEFDVIFFRYKCVSYARSKWFARIWVPAESHIPLGPFSKINDIIFPYYHNNGWRSALCKQQRTSDPYKLLLRDRCRQHFQWNWELTLFWFTFFLIQFHF